MKKTFLKIVGYLSVALGFAGAFLPLVPTTPLLLLALWCFSRSSPKMNAWLLGNRMFGRYLKDYEQGRGIPKVVKVSSVIILWSSILFTTIVFTEAWWLRALLLLMALLVSVHIPEPEDAADRIENPGSDSHCNGRREIRRKPAAERRGRNHRHRPLPQRIQHLPPYPAPPSPYGDLGGDRRNLIPEADCPRREPVGKGRKRCRPGSVPAGRIPSQIRGAVGMPVHPAGDDVLNGRQQHAQCRLGPVCRAQRRTT
ncbi:MAG: YbaN family protein [Alistipes indistinctus]